MFLKACSGLDDSNDFLEALGCGPWGDLGAPCFWVGPGGCAVSFCCCKSKRGAGAYLRGLYRTETVPCLRMFIASIPLCKIFGLCLLLLGR